MDADKVKLQMNALLDADPAAEGDLGRLGQALQDSFAAKIYLPNLLIVRDEMAKPPAQRDYTKLNAALKASNLLHDGYGRSFWLLAMSILADPGASAAAKKAAEEMLAMFLPSRSELMLDHASEIANALRREPLVEPNAASLDLMAASDGRTGKDLVEGMIKAAKERAVILRQRGSALEGPVSDGTLWAQAWGLIGELRQALSRELPINDKLPRDLDRLAFGLMDQIE